MHTSSTLIGVLAMKQAFISQIKIHMISFSILKVGEFLLNFIASWLNLLYIEMQNQSRQYLLLLYGE